ncbi:MAG: nucleotidyltransferase family protein [Gammaproteobacteria bacterium]|nr:MAG: nucleotidyltransferase family protein [Gammaproteobacteria bacterium]
MVRGVLLAAGRGRRFGADKLMQPLEDGRTLALTSAQTLIDVLPGAIAVCRSEQTLLKQQLEGLGFQVKICDQADQGMGFTLATAVAASGAQDNFLVALADMPFVKAETLQKLVLALQSGAALTQPRFGGRAGNPVGVGRRFRDQLIDAQGDFGARQLLRQHANEIAYIDVDDPGILQDIDRPEDLPCRNASR